MWHLDWHWWSSAIPLRFLCHLSLSTETWSESGGRHLIDIQSENKKKRRPSCSWLKVGGRPPTRYSLHQSFVSCVSTTAGEDISGRLWRNRVRKVEECKWCCSTSFPGNPTSKSKLSVHFFSVYTMDGCVWAVYTFCDMYNHSIFLCIWICHWLMRSCTVHVLCVHYVT